MPAGLGLSDLGWDHECTLYGGLAMAGSCLLADRMVTRSRHLRLHAAAGLLGGGVALAVLLLARADGGAPGLLELVADAVVVHIPPWLFAAAVAALGGLAKGILFGGISLAFLAIASGLALGFGQLGFLPGPGRSRSRTAIAWLVTAGITFMLGELVVMPIAGVGFLGSSILSDRLSVHGPLAVACVGFAVVSGAWSLAWQVAPTATPVTSVDLTRRTVLRLTAGTVGVLGLVASGATTVSRVLTAAAKSLPGSRDPGGADGFGFTRAVTPVESFYVVSKDYVTLDIDPESWRLSVSGLVDAPRAYTLDEFRALPAREGYRTLQCISASSIQRMELIGNQRWKGVRLRDILDAVGVHPAAGFVLFRCADGYHESLTLDVAVDDDTWLAYEMGPPGTVLTADHGFPVRLLVAERYGMKQPKYVTDLILADRDEPGWWVKGGWQTDAPVRTYCRIDIPAADGVSDGVLAGHEFTAFGVASSGARGISRVEISIDDGESWRDAELEPVGGPIGPLTWVRWRATVRFNRSGNIRFFARATDGFGTLQDGAIDDAFPRGSSGYPRVPMTVYRDLPFVPTLPPTTPRTGSTLRRHLGV